MTLTRVSKNLKNMHQKEEKTNKTNSCAIKGKETVANFRLVASPESNNTQVTLSGSPFFSFLQYFIFDDQEKNRASTKL